MAEGIPHSTRLSLEQTNLLKELNINFNSFARDMVDLFLRDEEFQKNLIEQKESELNNLKKMIGKTKKIKQEKIDKLILETINCLKIEDNFVQINKDVKMDKKEFLKMRCEEISKLNKEKISKIKKNILKKIKVK